MRPEPLGREREETEGKKGGEKPRSPETLVRFSETQDLVVQETSMATQ